MLYFLTPIDLAIVMTNLPFHRTHQPEEPHNSVELDAMTLTPKYKLKQLVGALMPSVVEVCFHLIQGDQFDLTLIIPTVLKVIRVVVYFRHTKGDPFGLPLIWTVLNDVGVLMISTLSSPSKSDE